MFGIYTQEADTSINGLIRETDIAKIWADIDLLGDESSAEKWKAKINNIAAEYLLTPRFALMRFLVTRFASHISKEDDPKKVSYSVLVGQDLITHSDISLQHASELSEEEHINYIKCLMDIARSSPDSDEDFNEQIISKAWHDEESANAVMIYSLPHSIKDNPRKYKKAIAEIKKENKNRFSTKLSREEAFQLGHILQFRFEEMEWFLMRVFHAEENGFRMNHSDDIIEAFAFKRGASCRHTARLKEQYAEISTGIEKKDDSDRNNNWTKSTQDELWKNFEKWKQYPDKMDEKFLLWLGSKASGLDIPSHTAIRIYRNLAIYAYTRIIGLHDLPSEEIGFLDDFEYLCDNNKDNRDITYYLYQDGTVSQKKCKKIANCLYYENQKHTEFNVKDRAKSWRIITTQKNGELSSSYGIVNDSRMRIQKILMGECEVEKGDILYLVWFLLNLVWYASPSVDSSMLQNRIYDFKDIAGYVLEKALLPSVYLPHLMEQSIVLSIIYGGHTGEDPSIVYAHILESVKESRNRQPGSRKHSLEEKIDIVNQHRDGKTLKQCALDNKVSEKIISQWQKELIEAGIPLHEKKQKVKHSI